MMLSSDRPVVLFRAAPITLGAFALAMAAWIAGAVMAADPPAAPPRAAAAPVKDAATGTDADAKALREVGYYIPYKELRKVFEREGRGVFLPYEEFMTLWREARERQPVKPEVVPPVAFLISEATYAASVAKDSDVVSVAGELKIEILKPGWHEIPLRLADAAVTRAAIGNEPARLLSDASGYRLLVEKKGDAPETVTLKLDFARAYAKAPGQNSVAFEAPQAPVSRWQMLIPDTGIKVNIEPMIAASEAPATETAKETRLMAFVGGAPTVRVNWTPKAEGATGLEVLANVEAVHRVTIQEGVLRTQIDLVYDISRAELPSLQVDVPENQRVINVFDANVRQWSVAKTGAAAGFQRVEVSLFEPARKTQRLTVELEKYDPAAADGQLVTVPVVRAIGVVRQQGVIVVRVAGEIRADAAERAGLLQLDDSELPASVRSQKWDFAYRYAVLPYTLTLKTEKIKPRMLVEALTEVRLTPEELAVDLLAMYAIERAGVFRLEFDVPDGYEVRDVRGAAQGDYAAVQTPSHHLAATADKGVRRLTVDLSRKALGKVALAVSLRKTLAEPDLLTPTGKEAKLSLAVPHAADAAVEVENGRLLLYAPDFLRVTGQGPGLRKIDVPEALAPVGNKSPFPRPEETIHPVQAFAYAREPATLDVAAERRAPQVTVRQFLAASVEPGLVKFDITLFHEILYGTVKTLRLDVPADVAKMLRIQTSGVTESPLDPQPQDVAQGYVALSLIGEKDFAGEGRVQLTWQKTMDQLEVGKSAVVLIPVLKPRDGRAWGQIALSKAESIDIDPTDQTGLRPIDPQQDLMRGAGAPRAAWAFEFHGDWALKLKATRYELQAVKWTSVERSVVRVVVTRSGDASVQALYRMKSARQRLEVKLPANLGEFDDQPLRINGRSVAMESGEAGSSNHYYIPLTGLAADEPFLVELRYVVKGVGVVAPRIDLPVFLDEPAVQRLFLFVYLPEPRLLLGATGPWTREMVWVLRGVGVTPRPIYSESQLVGNKWLMEGLSVNSQPLQSFQTDGKAYLYSALQPAAPPDGSLRIVSMDNRWFLGVEFAVILLIGLVLTPMTGARRWFVLAAAGVLVVALAIFLPTFARQTANWVTESAVCLVLVLWFVWYMAVTRPRRKREQRLLMAAGAPTAPPASPPPTAPPASSGDAAQGPNSAQGGESND